MNRLYTRAADPGVPALVDANGGQGYEPSSRRLDGAGDPSLIAAYEKKRIGRAGKISQLAWNLTALSRWRSPVACAFRDGLITVMMATTGKRAQRNDMSYEF